MTNVRRYLACFFDTLGQKAAYQPLRRCYPELISPTEWEEIMRVSGESRWLLHRFTNIRDEIISQAELFYSRLAKIDHSIFSSIPIDEFVHAYPKDGEWGVCPFSDGILMYISCDHLWAGLIFTTWLSRLAEQMVRLHARKISVRGAISVGEAFHVRGGSIVGELVNDLLKYEGDVAFYSRIVVSPEFREFIEGVIKQRTEGKLIDPIFWDYKDLLEADFDGVLRLDYLSEYMIKILAVDGKDNQYVEDCIAAHKSISLSANGFEKGVANNRLDVSKSNIAWKYRYLQAYYEHHLNRLLIYKKRGERDSGIEVDPDTIPPGSPVNKPEEYYVCYLKVEKLCPLPPDADISGISARAVIGIDSCDSMTAAVLSRFIGQFNINREEWLQNPQKIYAYSWVDKTEWPQQSDFCAKALELTIGVEQAGNYLLFYVRNQNPLAQLCFLVCIQLASVYMLDAMCSNHIIRVSCVKGIGWELEQDHLMGTCIEDAHKLLSNYSFYPRFMIAPQLAKELLTSKTVATFLGKDQAIYEDVDGVFFWDYLSIVNKFLYEEQFKILSYEGSIEFVYKSIQKRLLILTHKKQINNQTAPRIREFHSLSIYLSHKLQTYNVDIRAVIKELQDWYAHFPQTD